MSDWSDPPAKLADRDIWLIWGYEEREDADGETYQTKVPLDPRDGGRGDATDPQRCTDYESAREACANWPDAHGIGFAFHSNDTLAGVDLDDVRDPETGELTGFARGVITTLDSYTEVSPSGTGLHTVVVGFKPGDRCRTGLDDGSEIEMYDEDRFFTYTGERAGDGFETVEQRHNELGEVYRDAFDVDDGDGPGGAADIEPPDLDLDDEQVLEKARNAENSEKFDRLWNGHDPQNDTSYGDKALCQMLAFWTGGDRQQIDSLFRASGRRRDKWDEDRGDETYGERTIGAALDDQTEFYEPGGGAAMDVDTDGDEPADWVQTAWDEHAETIADPSGPGELGEAVEQTIDVLVAAHASGMARPTADMWLKELSDQSDKAYTKSGLADLFERRMDAAVDDGATGEGDGEIAPRVPEFMENHLQRVVVNRVTDHNVDTSYQWHFNGDLNVVFSTTGGTHWDWFQFRERYFDETGVDLREPTDGSAEEWRAFVVELIDERGVESHIRGPRTETIGALKNYIERRTAYGGIDAAALREGVYLDGEDADELWVLSKDIQRLCSERDVTTRGLQEELRACGLTSGSRVAERRRSSGTRVTWWRLSADIAEPRTYEDGQDIVDEQDDESGDTEDDE